MNRVRLAVVGTGHLGSIHARLAAKLDEIELVAVVDANTSTRSTVALETGARPIANYRDLIGEIDGAVVATPTSTHHAVAGELLRAGVHCFVEKPISPTSAEADDLVQLARRRQAVLQVGHVERFNPGFTAIRSHLADPKYIEARRHSGFTCRSTDVGVVLDLMIHDIDAALSLVRSPVTRVDALGVAVLGEHEDVASARLQFASGAVAQFTASRVSYEPARTMQVFTSRRFASIDFAARTSTLVEPTNEVLRRRIHAKPQALGNALYDDVLVKQTPTATEANAIEQELLDFAAAIEQGRTPQVTGADGRDAVAVAELILESVANHQWDGCDAGRIGPQAMPTLPVLSKATLPVPSEAWSDNDTVISRRKAG